MTTKLLLQALGTFLFGTLLLGVLLFLPAGTFNYWQAWAFIAVFMITITIFGLYFSVTDPALIERRKQAGPAAEQSPLQKVIATVAFTSFFCLFIFGGLDHRFGWSHMPSFFVWVGDALVALAFYLYYLVFKENSFGAANVRVEQDQKVISTGPYALVRHPMYTVGFVFLAGITLGIGSWWGLSLMLLVVPVIVIRILDEEKLLAKDLPGYAEYEQKVHYRLLPYIW